MLETSNTFLAVVGVICAFGLYRLAQVGKRDPRMPPGPPTQPLLGNIAEIPLTGLGKRFAEWAKVYGPIFSLKVGPGNIIVICDRKAVYELIDKKGSIYSDRPPNVVPLFITRGNHMTMEKQGPSWREKRTVVTRNLNPKSLDEKHFRVQEAEAVMLMSNLLRDPDNFFSYSRLYATSVASILAWGFRAKTLESWWFKDPSAMIEKFIGAIEPGANPPIDLIPWLWYMPGKWKRRAYDLRDQMDKTWTHARNLVDSRRAKGDERECMIDMKLDEYNQAGWPMSQHAFNNLFGELMEAGADTTANQILTIILALAKYPHVQAKARKEIDAVCGSERAPVFSDFDQLPYINAIVKEGLRWRPTTELGLPHTVAKDDWYNGMLIPKGSTIFVGVWAMHHDENHYKNHETFDPDRFLKHPKLANELTFQALFVHHYGYGAGRRICPGMHLAERSMWRIAAKLIWAFDISEPVDPKTGKVQPLDVDAYTSSNLVCPMPFNVQMKPRSQAHVESIKREIAGAEEFLSQYE
ncbi:cytochrome P450 oxidoreductase [Fusarium agapanthi]|uniref:Cytochrome P450 oxidoreductase n=1 Tax=Fusarium agapanthi TaxID=1803897 RepID=A0A9P5E2V1_9HYPO|nr:cytochrome P450 oxidoreductase [Fusarium agapanthi]